MSALWVRETWSTEKSFDSVRPSKIPRWARIHYLADGPKSEWCGKTRPAIFMVRWMSRIALEITEIRVERLQEISEEDARAEGLQKMWSEDHGETPGRDVFYSSTDPNDKAHGSAVGAYSVLWDHINAKKHPWKSNPWVWAITFRVL